MFEVLTKTNNCWKTSKFSYIIKCQRGKILINLFVENCLTTESTDL